MDIKVAVKTMRGVYKIKGHSLYPNSTVIFLFFSPFFSFINTVGMNSQKTCMSF